MNTSDFIFPYRDRKILQILLDTIYAVRESSAKPLNIMEVCGGHTHTILKYGLHTALKDRVRFLHGPGCPVCIIPKENIDYAMNLALLDNVILVTLGDLMRVPGSKYSPAMLKAAGRDIRFVYSPADVPDIASQNPDKKIVYFAIGFETTTPHTAYLVKKAAQLKKQGLDNIFFYINHVLAPPAMEALLQGKHCIDAFIGPSHVSAVSGAKIYGDIKKYRVPVIVAGFEPADILESVLMALEQAQLKTYDLQIQYTRAVDYEGNLKAQSMVEDVFCTAPFYNWRGLGAIKHSSLMLREEYAAFDAEKQFAGEVKFESAPEHPGCICPQILRGQKTPADCGLFRKICTPQNPFGSCMVSGEGACAAYYKYF